jgi:hypothetical protein
VAALRLGLPPVASSSGEVAQSPAQRSRNEDGHEVVHRYGGPAHELFTHAVLDHLGRDAPKSVGQLGAEAANLKVFADKSGGFVHGAHLGGHGSHGPQHRRIDHGSSVVDIMKSRADPDFGRVTAHGTRPRRRRHPFVDRCRADRSVRSAQEVIANPGSTHLAPPCFRDPEATVNNAHFRRSSRLRARTSPLTGLFPSAQSVPSGARSGRPQRHSTQRLWHARSVSHGRGTPSRGRDAD